jgi:hypothetical protein
MIPQTPRAHWIRSISITLDDPAAFEAALRAHSDAPIEDRDVVIV